MRYETVVRGELSDRFAPGFEGMTCRKEGSISEMSIDVAYPAAEDLYLHIALSRAVYRREGYLSYEHHRAHVASDRRGDGRVDVHSGCFGRPRPSRSHRRQWGSITLAGQTVHKLSKTGIGHTRGLLAEIRSEV